MAALVILGSSGSAVLAATGLHQTTPITSTDAAFQGSADECAGANLAPGQVLWHFVLVQTTAINTGTLSATFQNAGPQTTSSYTQTGSTLHWTIVTPTADTLLSASTDANGKLLNLSHICQGPPLTTTTTSSSSSSSSTTTSSSTASSTS